MHARVLTLAVLSDQISKEVIRRVFPLGESYPLLPGILHLTHHNNTGAAFGLFRNSNAVLIVVSAVLILITTLWYIRARSRSEASWLRLGLLLVIAGALGNLVDRVRLGYVVDFIDIRVWPIFNIADSCITVGAVLALSSFLWRRSKS